MAFIRVFFFFEFSDGLFTVRYVFDGGFNAAGCGGRTRYTTQEKVFYKINISYYRTGERNNRVAFSFDVAAKNARRRA